MRDLHGPLHEVEEVYHQIPFRTRLNTAQYGVHPGKPSNLTVIDSRGGNR
jgi:hypothetical protein